MWYNEIVIVEVSTWSGGPAMERITVFAQEVPFPAFVGGLACGDEVLWPSLVALATGALLGVMAGMRYDVLFGLPEPACAVLRSLVLTATWSCVGQVQPAQIEAAWIGSAKE
jgi:hypothetical protein